MRINSRLSNSDKNLFDCFEIKYALLGCLAFTNKEDKLREMLLYVLLCSASLDDKLSGERSIFDVIDHMTYIIGPDYSNCTSYEPAKILNSLDKDSKITLYMYMNDSANVVKESTLQLACQRLEEKLYCKYGDVKEMRVFQPDVYLNHINDYLTFRLNQISISIAKEIYNSMHINKDNKSL